MASTKPTPVENTQSPGGRFAKSWVARIVLAIGSPVLLLLILELILALFGAGRNTAFFIPHEKPGMFRTNPRYTELFFPESFGLKPLNFQIPREKPEGTHRVFVLGESAAMGMPEPGFSLSVQLQAQLRAANPGKTIRVYNLGITAINSHVIRHLTREAIAFDPDLVVIYMGNNETVGPYGPSSAFSNRMPPLGFIRASIWIRGTRTGQLLERLIAVLGSAGTVFQEWSGMEMFAGNVVPAGDPRIQVVYDNFAANLGDILGMLNEAGIKSVLSTVAVNVKDSAPFESIHGESVSSTQLAEWNRLFGESENALVVGEFTKARELLDRAIEIDPLHADAHFIQAGVLENIGEPEQARVHYLEALSLDALRFRADATINQIIRERAGAAGGTVSLVDSARNLGSDPASTVEPAGQNFFLEHVHLRWEGNFSLALMLARQCSNVLFGARDEKIGWLTPEQCADVVGFTPAGKSMMLMRMDELTTRPPFTGQRTFAMDRGRLLEENSAANEEVSSPGALQAALASIERARLNDPENTFLPFHEAAIRMEIGDFSRALSLNQSLDALEPPSPERTVQRAYLLQELGRSSEAETLLLQSARSDPYYFQTYGVLGSLWLATGEHSKSLTFFEELVSRMPQSRGARLTYARLLSANENWEAAEEQWLEVLRYFPDNEGALEPLLYRYFDRGLEEEALELMLKAFAYNPRSFENNARLVEVYQQLNDIENSIKYMRALAESGPVNAAFHLDLAHTYAVLNRDDEAVLELHRATKKAEGPIDPELMLAVEKLIER